MRLDSRIDNGDGDVSSSPVTGLEDSAKEAKSLEKNSMLSNKPSMAKASRSFHIWDRLVRSCVAYSFRSSMAESLL